MNQKLRCVVITLISLCFVYLSPKYLQAQDEAHLIESAHDFAVDLVSLSKDLPSRWMATQQRQRIDTGKIDEFLVQGNFFFEFMASDATLGVVYTYLREGGESSSTKPRKIDSIESVVEASVRKDMVLHRLQNEGWKEHSSLPKFGYPSTFPFNWCIGFLNSASSGTLRDENILTTAFWGRGSECLTALKEGNNLVSIWGKEGNESYLKKISFDGETGLIKEFSLIKPHNNQFTKKDLQQKKYSVVEQGTVEWKSFPGLRAESKKELHVPVLVKVMSVMNEGSEIECTVQIEWKFGSDVPDSVFEDPRTSLFKRPF